ncbi:MAG: hypothetical protein AAGJ93_12690 [Bacteroidota bacterium]
MNELSVANYISFFKKLDLKQKVEILKELTNELGRVIDDTSVISGAPPSENVDDVVDELFGVWKNEDGLTEESIIDRTVSDKVINFD